MPLAVVLWLLLSLFFQVNGLNQSSVLSTGSPPVTAFFDLVTFLDPSTESLPVTTSFDSVNSSVQSTSTDVPPATTGIVHSSLESSGRTSAAPFQTSTFNSPVASIQVIVAETISKQSAGSAKSASANIFAPIATNAPPSNIKSRSDHPAQAHGIVSQKGPLQTNKFYANLFLGDQSNAVWTHPYSVEWAKGGGSTSSWGLSISHIERNMLAWGPNNPPSGAPQYFISPAGIQSIVLSAAELGAGTVLTTESHRAFSVYARLGNGAGAVPLVIFPLVQGMGFVTGIYNRSTVIIQSGVFFNTLKYIKAVNKGITFKYRITLLDGTHWLLYATPSGAAGAPPLTLVNSTTIRGPKGYRGTIQIAKNPAGTQGEASYDSSAGAYPVSGSVNASVKDEVGSYKLSWVKAGSVGQKLLMFALPHHKDSMTDATTTAITSIELETTTKGIAVAVLADTMTFTEPELPIDIGFDPWSPKTNSVKFVSTKAFSLINKAAASELGQDMGAQSNLSSMYFSGKALSKFASIVYATYQFAGNSSLAAAGLKKLESAFAVFVNNRQQYPLVYDAVWKGVVSSATYTTKDPGVDFGNTFYNDHHFHYGYFVYAAAVIGYLDPPWLARGTNKAWVNTLVRDFANSVESDARFPFSRSFDWYHGHSWAKGLFDSGDGKDEESSSEDAFASYAIKMWGKVIGDANMEARGNLQLAIQARSFQNYFLMASDNTVQPARFIPNKVTGILFENKVDHTTYFGNLTEYVEGIHMIPMNPTSAYTRSAQFVYEEWKTYFAQRDIRSVGGGWRGILMANLAISDPHTSWSFFSDPNFDVGALDGGASLTWYLTQVGAMGGS